MMSEDEIERLAKKEAKRIKKGQGVKKTCPMCGRTYTCSDFMHQQFCEPESEDEDEEEE